MPDSSPTNPLPSPTNPLPMTAPGSSPATPLRITTPGSLPTKPLLIIFTDEFGSTQTDESEYERVFASGSPPDDRLQQNYKANLRKRRTAQFGMIVKQFEPPATLVVKNVGDSLVMRFKLNDDVKASIVQCIQSLQRAWSVLKTVRVAVHLAETNQIVVDGDLKPFVAELGIEEAKLMKMWPALKAIEVDIFGAPMNRAARLAGLPSKPLFVLSREVIEALGSGMSPDDKLASGRSYLSEALAGEGLFCSEAVPIPWLKGVERITLEKPWWALEVARLDAGWNLAQESKMFQCVRILNLELKSKYSPALLNTASARIMEFLSKPGTCRHYFTDLIFKIERIAKVYDASEERIFEPNAKVYNASEERIVDNQRNQAKWLKEDEFKDFYWPLFVVFTSAPNERADAQFREELTKYRGQGWGLEPTTLQVHQHGTFTGGVEDLKPSEMDKSGRRHFYLVVFQARREMRGLMSVDSPALFADIEDAFGVDDEPRFSVRAWGLLRGDKDGYILLEGWPNAHDDAVLHEIVGVFEYLPGASAFRNRVAPLRLYKLELRGNNASPGMWMALRGLSAQAK